MNNRERPQPAPRSRRSRTRSVPTSVNVRHSHETASALAAIAQVFRRAAARDDAGRLRRATLLFLCGFILLSGGAFADQQQHRGVETGAELPYVIHAAGRELAINVDFTRFTADQIPQIASVLQVNGFRYVRQPFRWSDIEATKGTYSWERHDAIVDALEARGIGVIAVLQGSPGWARSDEMQGFADAPPADRALFTSFTRAVVGHFGEKVDFIQVWNHPNVGSAWGGLPADPIDYLAFLADSFNAIRTTNPEAKVVLAEFDPRYADGRIGADYDYLKAIYDAGGAPFFDIVAIELDGGSRPPFDRGVDRTRQNVSRALLFRWVMTDYGDVEKPIWATHFGWSTGNAAIDSETQGDLMVAGMERARSEWPWMGLMVAWNLIPSNESDSYALLDSAGRSTPAFETLAEFGTSTAVNVAPIGFLPVDTGVVRYDEKWSDQHLQRLKFKTTSVPDASATIKFRGTGLVVFLRRSPAARKIYATIDGQPISGRPVENGAGVIDPMWSQAEDIPVVLGTGLRDGEHELKLWLAEPGELTLGGFVVTRQIPFIWPVMVISVAGGLLILLALREIAYVVAFNAGLLKRQRSYAVGPVLPTMPDWRPMRRT